MNAALLEDIMADLIMNPDRLDMNEWFYTGNRHVRDGTPMSKILTWNCGTTACIAGHALAKAHPKAVLMSRGTTAQLPDGGWNTVPALAADALEISEDLAHVLFYQVTNPEAVPALKFLIANPNALAGDLQDFLGREPGSVDGIIDSE